MKKLLLLLIAQGLYQFGIAQNIGINTTGAVPNASAGLDIDFSDKGLLVPRVSLSGTNVATPVTSPATGLLVFNTATVAGANAVSPGFYYWDGTIWQRIANGTSTDTDDQTLSTNGDTLFIADGNFVILQSGQTLDSAYNFGGKGQGRIIYKAFAESSPKIYDAILKAVLATAEYFNDKTELKKVA